MEHAETVVRATLRAAIGFAPGGASLPGRGVRELKLRPMRSLLLLLLWLALLAPVVLEAAEPAEAITLTAEEQHWEGDVWRGLGGVRILYQDIKISCDEMEFNRATQELLARGRVISIRARAASRRRAPLQPGQQDRPVRQRVRLPRSMYSFSGSLIEKIDETHYRVDDALFTTCGRDDPSRRGASAWKRALLEEEGFGRFTSSALRVQNFPVF